MTVAKRKTSKGETKEYHYNFMKDGKRYFGVCRGCTTKAEAEVFEKKLKTQVSDASKQKTVKALLENFREELSGGNAIKLDEAFELALQKPATRKPSVHQIAVKRNVWRDFLAFMQASYPEAVLVSDVTQMQAEAYLALLATNGRFQKAVIYIRNGKEITTVLKNALSSRTQIFYHITLQEVFDKIKKDAGLLENPFDFAKVKLESETREAFTDSEINLIMEKADNFIKPLFQIAFATALREGDICSLKWDEIDFEEKIIRRTMNKTGKQVVIPVQGLISNLLQWKIEAGDSPYVLPIHEAMYSKNSCRISYRIKEFLESIGIKTTKAVAGRSREISIKDLHSCRHTFCYRAGMQGIPLAVVQSIVGHMTPAMTAMYSAHATLTDKRQAIAKLQEGLSNREKLKAIIDRLDEKEIQKLLKKYGK